MQLLHGLLGGVAWQAGAVDHLLPLAVIVHGEERRRVAEGDEKAANVARNGRHEAQTERHDSLRLENASAAQADRIFPALVELINSRTPRLSCCALGARGDGYGL